MRDWALPAITGRWLSVYRAVWWLLFALAIGSQVLLLVQAPASDYARLVYARAGLTADGAGGIHLAAFGPAATQAGLIDGDRLVAAGGHRVAASETSDDPALLAALDGPDDSTLPLQLLAPDGHAHAVTLRRGPEALDRIYAGSGLDFSTYRSIGRAITIAGAVPFLLVGLLLFHRRPRDPVVALISVGMVTNMTWLPLYPGVSGLVPGVPDLLPAILATASVVLIEIGLLFFPDGRMRPTRTAIAALVLTLLGGLLQPASLLLPAAWGLPLFLVAASSFLFVMLAVIGRYRRLPPGAARQQIRWVLFGVVACAALLLVYIALESMVETPPTSSRGLWLSIATDCVEALEGTALALGFLVSLLRFRLYDADALISRSAAYACITLLLGAVFTGAETALQVVGGNLVGGTSGAAAAGLAASVAAAVVAPAHGRIHRWTEHHFQRALVRLRRELPKRMEDLRETATLPELLATAAARVAEGVRASRVAILVDGSVVASRGIDTARAKRWSRGWTAPDAAQIVVDPTDALFPTQVPLAVEEAGPVGWLLLGPRPDGSLFGKDERQALDEIAEPMARAIHIVRHKDAEAAALDRRIGRLEVAMETLLDALATRAVRPA